MSINWVSYGQGDQNQKILHSSKLNLDAAIYRRMEWQYAAKMFRDGKLRLASVRDWDDQYETSWCDQLFGSTPGSLWGIKAFGACWTASSFDEPLWRMAAFQAKDDIVRLRSTPRILLDAVRRQNRLGTWFMAPVTYRRERTLWERMHQFQKRQKLDSAAEMLMLKRNAFRFEQEIRLLYFESTAEVEVFMQIDAPRVISQLMTSPYSDLDNHSKVVQEMGRLDPSKRVELKRSLALVAKDRSGRN